MIQQPQVLGPKGRRRDKSALNGWKKELWDWSKALLIAIVVVLILRAFVFQLSTVKNISMQPTLYENEWLFVNKLAYEFGNAKRSDIIILKDPRIEPDHKQFLVKRIIGIPGDTLEIRGGHLYLNGELTVEPYTDVEIEDGNFGPVTVSEGHYFVMGDNRHMNGSTDSRSFQEISIDSIQGRADFILWPISRWAKL